MCLSLLVAYETTLKWFFSYYLVMEMVALLVFSNNLLCFIEWSGYSSTGKLYTGLPGKEIQLVTPSGKSWIHIDRQTEKDDATSSSPTNMNNIQPAKPVSSLRFMDDEKTYINVASDGTQTLARKTHNGYTKRVQTPTGVRFTTRKTSDHKFVLTERPCLPRIGVDCHSQLGYVNTQDGVLILSDDSRTFLLIAAANCVIFAVDGTVYFGKLKTLAELLGCPGRQKLALSNYLLIRIISSTAHSIALIRICIPKTINMK